MIVDQVSVFVENKPGALADIAARLAEAGVDLNALTIADTSEFGVMRFLSDSPKKALALLKLNGWVASLTPVVAVRMDDRPGALAQILMMFSDEEIMVEY
ncbi:MAG: ACT domain-containing protein, partial [Clostridiales bacterium]|nr:ACT domain-containing protein [Clostridiales bacterium]